jgi:1,4-dihydroxy-2-naphthoate polyprenyltransferase
MARPLIMLSVIQVYVAGTLIAHARGYALDVAAFGWGLAALLLIAVSIHYTNEYADHETDALTRKTPFSGGSGVLPRGLVPPRVALHAAWVTLILGFFVALIAVAAGALPLSTLPVLIIGAVGGWMYSLPPLKLAWHGWGELDNALLGGTALMVYGFTVQAGHIDADIIAACMPFTGLAFLNLLATTWADRHADAQVGKYTLATRWPTQRLRRLYGGVAVCSLGLLLVLYDHVLPPEVAVASLLVLPFTVWGYLRYTRTDAPHASVYAMIVMLAAQVSAWFWVGLTR